MVCPEGEGQATELKRDVRGKRDGLGLHDPKPGTRCTGGSHRRPLGSHRKNSLTLRTALSGKSTSFLFGSEPPGVGGSPAGPGSRGKPDTSELEDVCGAAVIGD